MQRQVVYVGGGFSLVFLFLWVAFIAYSFPLVWILIFVFLFLITVVPTGYYVVEARRSNPAVASRRDLQEDKEVLLQI